MTPRFDPATYPGERPAGAVLVWDGGVHPLDLDGPAPAAAGAEAPVLTASDRRYLVAFGSNAAPDRLVDKGLDRRGSLLLPAVAWGWTAAWEARRSASTGAVPLTLVAAPGRRMHTWVQAVHPEDLERLDASEFRGRNYRLGVVGDVAVAGRWCLPRAFAFGPGPATRVLADPDGGPLTLPPHDQRAAARILDAGGDALPVEPLPGSVGHVWPSTALEPLDLFVYGTLGPGQERWDAVAALVVDLGPARTAGRVYATPMGWPAAVFLDGDPGVVHGRLLRPRDEAASATLYRRVDEIEGEGSLFRRVAVRVHTEDGASGWAAAYRWHPDRGEPPGELATNGRWDHDG